MTNPLALIPLTVDGTDVQQDPIGIFLEIVRGLNESPRVRGIDSTVPERAGRIPRNRKSDGFVLELKGFVYGIGSDEATRQSSYRDLVATFRALFDPTGDVVDVVATLENGDTATCSARTLPTVIWIEDSTADAQAEVSVEMESGDADWVIT